jgi:uncharacterized protein YutE (UPF0331/DUF86 family)
MVITCQCYDLNGRKSWEKKEMNVEFSGIERRLDELSERLARLEPLRDKPRSEFDQDPYLRDIVERNLEITAQCCIDICHRIIALENARKPTDYYEAILIMGELGVLPVDFSQHLAPMAGFRNILVHEYISVDWDLVYEKLRQLDDLDRFRELVRLWMKNRGMG